MWPDIRTAAYAETGRNRFRDTHWAAVSQGASIGNHVRAVDGGLRKHEAMAGYTISESNKFTHTDLVGLYTSVGWTSYANDPETLARAVGRSAFVVSARDLTGQLVGLARAISDDVSVCYLQDILVRPGQQRSGIGKALVDRPRLRATVVAGEDTGNPVVFAACTSICSQPEGSLETKTGLLRHPRRRKIARKSVPFNAIETQARWPLIEGEVQNRVYRLGQDPLASVLRRHPVSDRGLTGVYVVESDDTGELIVESDGPRTG